LLHYRLKKAILCTILCWGTLMGAPLTSKNIDETFKTANQIVFVKRAPGDPDVLPDEPSHEVGE
jgi:hypothetical protein